MTNPCPTCGGDGEIPLMEEGDGGRFYGTGESDECPHCHGTGKSPVNPTQELPENPEQSKPTLPANPTKES